MSLMLGTLSGFLNFYDVFVKSKCSFLSFKDSKSIVATYVRLSRFVVVRNSIIKSFTYVGAHSKLINCEIGKFCSIADEIKIGLPTHPLDFISTSPIFFQDKWNRFKLVKGNSFYWRSQKNYYWK